MTKITNKKLLLLLLSSPNLGRLVPLKCSVHQSLTVLAGLVSTGSHYSLTEKALQCEEVQAKR